jgi:hypothetical protein
MHFVRQDIVLRCDKSQSLQVEEFWIKMIRMTSNSCPFVILLQLSCLLFASDVKLMISVLNYIPFSLYVRLDELRL